MPACRCAGKLNPRNNGTLGGKIIPFDQGEFVPKS
jgi:hypothetical protein